MIEIAKTDYEKADFDVSFSFWLRFSYTAPSPVKDIAYFKKKCYSVARLTEGITENEELGDRNLAVMICSDSTHPVYYFSTYDTESENPDSM